MKTIETNKKVLTQEQKREIIRNNLINNYCLITNHVYWNNFKK